MVGTSLWVVPNCSSPRALQRFSGGGASLQWLHAPGAYPIGDSALFSRDVDARRWNLSGSARGMTTMVHSVKDYPNMGPGSERRKMYPT